MKEGEYDSSLIGPSQASTFRSSDEIRNDILELIQVSDAISPKDIDVDVKQGKVTLRGRVDDANARMETESAAREVLGVTAVYNDLEIAA